MEIRVLGCSGGIGGTDRTTSFLINNNILIDAGTGVGDLTVAEMRQIETIFITHSHLDHTLSIPLLIDTVFDSITKPVVVYGLQATLDTIKHHILNWAVWPDFTVLPSAEKPVLRLEPILPAMKITLDDVTVESISVNHIVPAVGYLVQSASGGTFAFSGDTSTNDTFWDRINLLPKIDVLVVETAFPNKDRELCRSAKHYCPQSLANDLTKLQHDVPIWLSHIKPCTRETILRECRELIDNRTIQPLDSGLIFTV